MCTLIVQCLKLMKSGYKMLTSLFLSLNDTEFLWVTTMLETFGKMLSPKLSKICNKDVDVLRHFNVTKKKK